MTSKVQYEIGISFAKKIVWFLLWSICVVISIVIIYQNYPKYVAQQDPK